MKDLRTKGFIAIEVVITAAFILAVGFFALLNFSTSGTNLMDTVNGRLASLGIFGGSGSGTPIVGPVVYDENGYPEHLNIELSDVSPEESFGFLWDTDHNGWSIGMHGYEGKDSVVVPSHRSDGLPIVSVRSMIPGESTWGIDWDRMEAEGMFEDNYEGPYIYYTRPITSIVLPNTIKHIHSYAFLGLDLEDFIIPHGVTEISSNAFSGSKLTSVFIPPTVRTIGNDAFFDTQLTSVVISEGVTEIGWRAFANNQLSSVVMPSTLTTMETKAFADNQISSLVISDGVTTVGHMAFANNNLSSVVIPGSVEEIHAMAFINNRIESITLSEGLRIIENFSFSYNRLTPEAMASIPSSVTELGSRAFINQFETWDGIIIPE